MVVKIIVVVKGGSKSNVVVKIVVKVVVKVVVVIVIVGSR